MFISRIAEALAVAYRRIKVTGSEGEYENPPPLPHTQMIRSGPNEKSTTGNKRYFAHTWEDGRVGEWDFPQRLLQGEASKEKTVVLLLVKI